MMYNNFNYEHYGSFGFNPLWAVGFSLLGILAAVFIVAILALKGYSLWIAARRNEKWWFIALLFINTLGLLELAYLIFVAKVIFNGKKCKDCKECTDESHHHHHHEHVAKAEPQDNKDYNSGDKNL